ncbi:MAG: AI-2E family transporter, partial [Bdellovibrionales bacterium]|nr:AI-2E family transporter [Bdellovibrionales bacterium]
LHPITVVVAMIVGAQLLGILGMIISIPVASALKITITSVYQHLVEFRA